MNVFSKNGFKIEYTMRISFSPTVFVVSVTIVRIDSKSKRIIVNQQGSYIEIIKVLDNFMVSFTSKSLTSSLTLESEIVKCLAESYENILESVSSHKKVKQPFRDKIK